jgi:hypothetical protein
MTNDVNWSGCIRGTGNNATNVALWRADADGCLPESSAATVSGRIWPVVRVRGGARKLSFAAGLPLSSGGYPRSGGTAAVGPYPS